MAHDHYPNAKRPTRHPIWMELAERQAARRRRNVERAKWTLLALPFLTMGVVIVNWLVSR